MVQMLGWLRAEAASRLAPEAFQRLRVARQFIGKEFQADEAMQAGVFGLVDDAHPATA